MRARIQIKVVPRAKRPGVEQMAEGTWTVAVIAPPHGATANAAVVDALAKHLDVPKSAVKIVRGLASRSKEVEITYSRC